jgi:phosphomannomutase
MAAPPEVRAPIRFGTSGWRGVLAEDFTWPRLRAALHAVGAWFAEEGGGEVVVAHDTRFLSEPMAEEAARILAAHGVRPVLGQGPVPTPVAARAVLRRRAAGAVVLTASHNPPEYQGLKVLAASGGCIDDASARRIEGRIGRDPWPGRAPGAAPRRVDLCAPYLRELLRCLDVERIERARARVVYDAMHGTGAGVLDVALSRLGLRVRVLRGDPDPRFGGSPPDPTPPRLRGLAREVRRLRGARLGLATDGDADRFAALDAAGRPFSETEALALLVDHLARSGRLERGVAVSIATGSLVERVAASHGLPLRRHPIGFKHLSRALLRGEADVAGEESGGFAFAGFGRDKDGILAGCLLAEMAALSRVPLRARLAALLARHGPSACGRIALPVDDRARQALAALCAAPPKRVDGAAVRRVSEGDGLHLALDDGFLMLRLSGTEPALRVYAEARGPRRLSRRLAAGQALLGLSGVSRGSR